MATQVKIMVVDDEKHICESVEKILKKNNYDVVSATSAEEALAKMAKESFGLLISDIVMPKTNGLELLKLVKKDLPLTKAIMMTAYAATDTAMKAIRLGALDYLPKPFTPDELRSTVEKALSGDLQEAPTTARDRDRINPIDIDIPFDTDEVAAVTGPDYAKQLGRSDMPVVEVTTPEPMEGFCATGNMVCDIFKKLGATCKAGTKSGACPQLASKKTAKSSKKHKKADTRSLIGVDMPFSYNEVTAVTGPEYVRNLHNEYSFVPWYEEVKANVARLMESERIDVDVPFDRFEVAKVTGEDAALHFNRSDMPVIEIKASEPLEGYCATGEMVCEIFKKLGATCKAGVKNSACPQKSAKKSATHSARAGRTRLGDAIGPDMPFSRQEVAAVTGTEYADHLLREGTMVTSYETLKKNIERLSTEAVATEEPSVRSAVQSVLVVDDEVSVNNNIRKILMKKGFSVDQATTKAQALEKIQSRAYEVVLLDLKIPGVRGLELLESIRKLSPTSRVVIVTGYASIETAVASARLGAVDYLSKPFTPDEIRRKTVDAFQMAA